MQKNKVIVFIVLAVIAGFVIGFMAGTYVTIKSVAEIASGFIDADLIEKALFQYKEHIKACYPSLTNASLYADTGM